MLYTPDYPYATPEAVSLRSISRSTKNKTELAVIAARIHDNRTPVCDLSVNQLAVLFRTTPSAINRHRVRKGRGRRKTAPALAEHILNASPAERIEAARQVGVELIWNSMIAPAIDEDGTVEGASTGIAAPAKTAEELLTDELEGLHHD